RHPRLYFVGRCVDNSELRLGLVGGEDPAVVVRDGDALRFFRDGNDGEGLFAHQVQDGDGAGPDVGGVAAASVVREYQHVRLRLAGGDVADDLARLWIDDGDGVIEFGG